MTIALDSNKVVYVGNSVTTVFPFSFRVDDVSDLQVYLETTATGDLTLLTQGVDYTVAGVPGAGSVTYNPLGIPMPATQQLIILREVDLLQGLDINNQGGFYPEAIEAQLDKIVMGLQQLSEGLSRTVQAKLGQIGYVLPVALAGAVIGWNALGTELENKVITGSSVAVSDDATLTSALPHATLPTQYAVKTYVDNNALVGKNTANYAGADENARIAAMFVAAPTQPYMYRSDTHFGLIRDTAPLNYQGTRAAFVIQLRDAAAGTLNMTVPAVMFQMKSTGDGVVTAGSDLSQSIWWGVTASMVKTGDGSGQAFTAVGSLGAYGVGTYNELGLFCGTATNTGSSHGTMSGVEVLLRDSPDGGTTKFDTAMHGVISRIARYQAGARDVSSFFASSEGTVGPGSILSANPSGFHTWARGINFKDALFTTGQAALFPNNTALAWMNAAASAVPVMFLSGADEFWFTSASTTTGFTFGNSALAQAFHITNVASQVNYTDIVGAITANNPIIRAIGTDTNVGLGFGTKGTGAYSFYTGGSSFYKQVEIANVTSSVNYVQFNGAVTTAAPLIAVQGSDTNIGLGLATKGTGVISLYTNGTVKQVEIAHVATAVNYVKLSGAVTTGSVRVEPEGSDTNIGILITGKGTGRVIWNVAHISATATAGTNGAPPAQVSGYLQMLLSPNVVIRVPYYNQ